MKYLALALLLLVGCYSQPTAAPSKAATQPAAERLDLTTTQQGNVYTVTLALTTATGLAKGFNLPVQYSANVVQPVDWIEGDIVQCQRDQGTTPFVFINMDPLHLKRTTACAFLIFGQGTWTCTGTFTQLHYLATPGSNPHFTWGSESSEQVMVRDSDNQPLPFVLFVNGQQVEGLTNER